VATQLGEVAGPAGILLLGVYTTVYVAKAVIEVRRADGAEPHYAVMAAGIAHIEKTINDVATELRTINARMDMHGERLTRSEAIAANQSRDMQRMQRHMDVLQDRHQEDD
jgi:hypothetical protein